MRQTNHRTFPIIAFLAIAGGACAGTELGPGPDVEPQPGHAFLTIVGDRNVFVESGSITELTVKYADENGVPLAGAVEFHIEGAAAGAGLSDTSGVTNVQGLVRLNLTGGEEAAFRIVAEAAYATPVDWRVAVSTGEPPLPPLNVAGTYDLDSQFNIVSGLPGTVGDVVNTIIDMTDSPNDPATWVIDKALEQIGSADVRNAVNVLRPALDTLLNGMLKEYAPDIVTKFIALGDQFGQVSRKFGLDTELMIAASGADGEVLTGRHIVKGVFFTIDTVRYDYTMSEMGMSELTAEGINISLSPSHTLSIADHSFPMSYGQIVLYALNNLVIPLIDPWASNIKELLLNYIDCYSVSYDIYDFVGAGSPTLYEAACQTGVEFAAALIEGKIAEIGQNGTSLTIRGDAKAMDTNADNTADRFQTGLWEGSVNFGITQSTLARPEQKFIGERVTP
jgi:hypothetical protein